MNIYGKKIVLKAISTEDVQLLCDIINDPGTEKMLGGSSFPVSREEQKKWIEAQIGRKDVLRCVIEDIDSGKKIGTVILSDIDLKNGIAQVHIKLGNDNVRGKGYGYDAINTVVAYAFDEMRINCVFCSVLTTNIASQRMFEKCGFTKEGVLRSRVYKGGSYQDYFSYSILKKEFYDESRNRE